MAGRCPLCRSGACRMVDRIHGNAVRRTFQRRLRIRIRTWPVGYVALHACGSCGLLFFDPPLAGGEDLYDQLQKYPWYYLEEKEEHAVAARFVAPGDCVLEVGAGDGSFAARISHAVYVGLEINARAAARARDRGLQMRQETVEVHAAAHAGRYDVVCLFQVLEHIPQPREFLEACARCLAPGGRLVVSVPDEDSFLGVEVGNPLNLPPHHVTRWCEAPLRQVGELLGLELLGTWNEQLSDLHLRSYAICLG